MWRDTITYDTRTKQRRGEKLTKEEEISVAFLTVDVEGSRCGGIEIREDVLEVAGRNWSTVKESSITDGGLG